MLYVVKYKVMVSCECYGQSEFISLIDTPKAIKTIMDFENEFEEIKLNVTLEFEKEYGKGVVYSIELKDIHKL